MLGVGDVSSLTSDSILDHKCYVVNDAINGQG